jgi:hypothetical protein
LQILAARSFLAQQVNEGKWHNINQRDLSRDEPNPLPMPNFRLNDNRPWPKPLSLLLDLALYDKVPIQKQLWMQEKFDQNLSLYLAVRYYKFIQASLSHYDDYTPFYTDIWDIEVLRICEYPELDSDPLSIAIRRHTKECNKLPLSKSKRERRARFINSENLKFESSDSCSDIEILD